MALDRTHALRDCYLFGSAAPESLKTLSQSSRIITFKKRKNLFFAGDPSDGLHIVVSGLVRIWISNDEGQEYTLALLEPGDAFGEIALLDGLPRTASATAIETTETLFVPAPAVERALERDAKLARHIIYLLCEVVRRNTEAMGAFAFLGLDARLARKLYDLATAHSTSDGSGAVFVRRFSQTDLAQMLGVTREAVNKRLAILIHDGLVSQTDGYFTIGDLQALSDRARATSRFLERA